MSTRLFILLFLASCIGQGRDFSSKAPCRTVWGKLLPAMLKAGFQPTSATNIEAGVAVFEYRQGAGTYSDPRLVARYTTERPGAITSYQVFGIQQASISMVPGDPTGCGVTAAIDFIAYKTSFMQTGWLKLQSSGELEYELVRPVITAADITAEASTPLTAPMLVSTGCRNQLDPSQVFTADELDAAQKLISWLRTPESDPQRLAEKIRIAVRLDAVRALPTAEQATARSAGAGQ